MAEKNYPEIIRELLKNNPRGLTVQEVAKEIGLNRNSTARYLDVLASLEIVDVRHIGPAKLYAVAHKLTVQSLLSHGGPLVVIDKNKIVQSNVAAQKLFSSPEFDAGKITFLTSAQIEKVLNSDACTLQIVHGDMTLQIDSFVTQFEDGTDAGVLRFTDLTTQVELVNQQTLLSEAIEASSCGITIADATQEDCPLIYVNKAFESITGYTREEVIGKNCRFLQGEDLEQESRKEIKAALKTKKPVTVIIKNYRKDGSEFYNELNIAPVKIGGDVTHFVGVQTDVSHRYQGG